MATRDTGQAFEAVARTHLEHAGLRTVALNAGYRVGELDLVMRDGDILVFVEVRYRRDARFGGASLSVTGTKRRRIAQAANLWLASHPREAQRPCRFDVVAIAGDIATPQIEWIRNAFSLDDA
ncbi:YraN family protein [Xanthomonadaceae bacterium JHOS43]|nr:YraN family protein [Xanthomonadaceae bacterium JHOS43]MCX7562805.1 YraN family protein [Xanthomonadaceae bacterium XH05]